MSSAAVAQATPLRRCWCGWDRRLRALFIRDPGSPYEVLGASPAETDDELKARHRRLVVEHHPDRLIAHGVPKAFAVMAEAKLAAINAAWDMIRKERHI